MRNNNKLKLYQIWSAEIYIRWEIMFESNDRVVLSSIHIEPIDRHEYNKSLVEKLTPYHKQKLLQFVRTERSFLNGKIKIIFQLKRGYFSNSLYYSSWNTFQSSRSPREGIEWTKAKMQQKRVVKHFQCLDQFSEVSDLLFFLNDEILWNSKLFLFAYQKNVRSYFQQYFGESRSIHGRSDALAIYFIKWIKC